jgi:hypothetical protein
MQMMEAPVMAAVPAFATGAGAEMQRSMNARSSRR